MPTKPEGPHEATIAFVGEAPGQQEDLLGCPFIGSSGTTLASIIYDAELDSRPPPRNQSPLEMIQYWRQGPFYLTNVFHERPPNNVLDKWLVPRAQAHPGLPALRPGLYLPGTLSGNLDRLAGELSGLPNLKLIVALGATATWALISQTKISKLRGYTYPSTLVPGATVLATFHPAAVLRNWELRVQVISDLQKIKTIDEAPPERFVTLEPTLDDISAWAAQLTNSLLCFDIETNIEQITCIGFAQSPASAFVVPFVDWRRPGVSYWSSAFEEAQAWSTIKTVLENPAIPKLGQNGLYDIQWLWRKMGIRVANYLHDTMLLSHSLQPELPKGLGWLGSVHAKGIGNWKTMRSTHQSETKRDE